MTRVERLERWEARLRAELEDVWSRYTRVAGQLAHARFVENVVWDETCPTNDIYVLNRDHMIHE